MAGNTLIYMHNMFSSEQTCLDTVVDGSEQHPPYGAMAARDDSDDGKRWAPLCYKARKISIIIHRVADWANTLKNPSAFASPGPCGNTRPFRGGRSPDLISTLFLVFIAIGIYISLSNAIRALTRSLGLGYRDTVHATSARSSGGAVDDRSSAKKERKQSQSRIPSIDIARSDNLQKATKPIAASASQPSPTSTPEAGSQNGIGVLEAPRIFCIEDLKICPNREPGHPVLMRHQG
ncbi:hypothetical protein BJ165DRAFT_1599428 [Panaeolus papilionaceus]|nr:hypothetical protein BJ165DRAFT_1599428 [Panaeolus papilionaceus]